MSLKDRPAASDGCGMDLITGLLTRRSIRKFTGEPIPEQLLRTILLAGLSAPSARNRRPFELVVIQNPDTLHRFAQENPYAPMLGTAAAAIAVCGNGPAEKHPEFLEQVCGGVAENILLAAHGLGLGAVWCGVRNETDWQAFLHGALHLPEGVEVRALAALGWPDQQPEPRDYWTPEKIHSETW